MFSTDTCVIRMLRSCLVDGEGRAEGEGCKVSLAAAHEAVVNGWAEFVAPRDAELARRAYVAEQVSMLSKLPQHRWPVGWPRTPWRRVDR
jgi:hypothetical protein